MKQICEKIVKTFLDFVAPLECFVCGQSVSEKDSYDFLCNKCLDLLPLPPPSEAIKNNIYMNNQAESDILRDCFSLFYVRTHFEYINLVYQIKYYGKKHIGYELGKLLAETYLVGKHYDCIVPIPLHRVKKRERGFNQAEVIGYGIAKVLGCPVKENVIRRKFYTVTQTKLQPKERKENVKGVFEVNEKFLKRELDVLIVDDVLTTGSTIYRCAEILKSKGIARNIDIATVVYA